MKKLPLPGMLFVTALTLLAALPAQAVNWTSAPGTVNSGESYYISADTSWPSSDINLSIYKNGSYFASGWGDYYASAGGSTTDYGSQTVHYTVEVTYNYPEWGGSDFESSSHDVTIVQPNTPPTITWVQAPASAAVNQWFPIQARGNDANGNLTQVFVWREWNPHAFNGGGNGYENYSDPNPYAQSSPGNVTFMAQATDSNGATSPVIYNTVNIYVPNQSPTVQWQQAPASAVVNQWFNVQARGDDPDGNIAWVYVWRDGQPFAFSGFPNGFTRYSDSNVAMSPNPGTITFMAQTGDAAGATSGYIYHTVSVINNPPSGLFTINGSASSATVTFGQTATLASSVTDPDGNLTVHSFWWDQGSGLYWTHPYLTWSYPPNSSGWLNLNLGADGYNVSGSASSRGFDFRATRAGTFVFHNAVSDPFAWVGVGASVLNITVNKATPASAFPNRNFSTTHTLTAADFNAVFTNPYSAAVAAPTGTVTYNYSVGTVLYPGSYPVTATYPGDTNYNPLTPTPPATFTVINAAPTATITIKTLTSGTTTGVIGEVLTIGVSGADADANLRAVNLWVLAPAAGSVWRNIRADSTLAPGFTENATTDNAINSASNVATLGSVNRTYTIPLGGGTGTYQFVVRSMDANGTASLSQQVNVTASKANQPALTLNAATPQVYGSTQTLSTPASGPGSGSGGGGVTYAITGQSAAGVATLTDTTLKANASSGWVDLQATKAGDANYNAVTSSIVRVNLSKAPLTITADNKTRVYSEANPAFTASYSGLMNGDTSAVVTGLILATTATPASSVGPYPITASGGTATNYTITHVPGILTIERKQVDFYFSNTTLIYNGAVQQPVVLFGNASANTVPPPGSWAPRSPQPTPPAGTMVATSATIKTPAPYTGYYFAVDATGNYIGSGDCSWTIVCCIAYVNLGNLSHVYDSTAKSATATTSSPSGLNVEFTYDGQIPLPVLAGTYAVHGEIIELPDGLGQKWGGYSNGWLVIAKANQAPLTLPATASQFHGTTLNLSTITPIAGAPGGGSGNGPVTYVITGQSAAGVASLSGANLTANSGAGWVDIQATKATGTDGKGGATGNYNPTTSNTMRVTLTKADQAALVFNPTTPQTYATTQTLAATGGSGSGAFSYAIVDQSAVGVATLAGNVLTANTGTGWVKVRASRAGDTNYNSATSNTVQVNFSKATATVTLGNLNPTYDGAPKLATATTTPTGLTVGLTYSGSTTPPTTAGPYNVLGTINDLNYQGSTGAIMTVGKATPVITWVPVPLTYGTGLGAPQLNATASTPGTFIYTPSAGTLFNPGLYPLNALFNATDSVNYVLMVPASVQLTVNKATPVGTITPAARSISTSGNTYVVRASDLNATFAHPTSTAVAPPTGTVTFAVVGGGPVTGGTVLTSPAVHTIRATYSGDANYTSASVDAVWTLTSSPGDPGETELKVHRPNQ